MSRPLLQLALDDTSLQAAQRDVALLADHVDIVEAGTILCLTEGLNAVRALREQCPDKIIVADWKVADAGETLAAQAFGAGANWMTIICAAPLATVERGHEVALRRYRDDPALLDLFGSNLEELQRMAGMVRDMLFLAQVDHGALARRSPVPSLRALIASVVDYHDALLDEAGLTVEVEGDGSGALDAPLLQRALSNLLGNACRYADRGSTIRIAVGHPAPGHLSLAVANRGPGIDAARLARIFDRFYRADDPARSHARHHHGLGLSIVAAVARMHGGTVHATSAPHGTCVTMELTLEPAACTGPCAGADNAGIRPPPAPASPIPEPSAARTGNRYGENDLHEP